MKAASALTIALALSSPVLAQEKQIILTPGPVQESAIGPGCSIPVGVEARNIPLERLAVSARAYDPAGNLTGNAGFRLEGLPVVGAAFPDQVLMFPPGACAQLHIVQIETATCSSGPGDHFACGDLLAIVDEPGVPAYTVDAR